MGADEKRTMADRFEPPMGLLRFRLPQHFLGERAFTPREAREAKMASPECATSCAQLAADCQAQFPGGRVPERGTSQRFGAGRGEPDCAHPPRGALRPAAKFFAQRSCQQPSTNGVRAFTRNGSCRVRAFTRKRGLKFVL